MLGDVASIHEGKLVYDNGKALEIQAKIITLKMVITNSKF